MVIVEEVPDDSGTPESSKAQVPSAPTKEASFRFDRASSGSQAGSSSGGGRRLTEPPPQRTRATDERAPLTTAEPAPEKPASEETPVSIKASIKQSQAEDEAKRKAKIDEFLGSSTKKLSEMSMDDKYAFSEKYRQAGNHFFREGAFAFALKTYQESITFIKHGLHLGTEEGGDTLSLSGGPPRPLAPEANKLLFLLLSNSAACHLKQKKNTEAISFCSRAYKLEPEVAASDNAKLHFRWGQALLATEQHEKALEQLRKAHAFEPQNGNIRSSLDTAKRIIKKQEKELYEAAKLTWKGKLPSVAIKANPAEDEGAARSTTSPRFPASLLEHLSRLWLLGVAHLWAKLKDIVRYLKNI
eukprot:CAMPEP_0198213058 /NCGR_PEP_ID=MMETSP1445-20131203/28650_1 /TAXON_ID=36898 /ORGANISM="Pyramimonas sp., Strain CCMP2087" /LENGTH=356 /DNA_ID=CAMNT_0043887649 /DNA_START=132 /DNA_END=1202 /DNA_ORIENTATION=+